MSEFHFILDKLMATAYPLPEYITYGQKTAANSINPPSYESTDIDLTSKENVWLSAVKAACLDNDTQRDHYMRQIKIAAARYGNDTDVMHVLSRIDAMRNETSGIKSSDDWEKGYNFLIKNADAMDNDVVEGLARMLLHKTAEISHIPAIEEDYTLRKLAGLPTDTPEIKEFAKQHFHKLANGSCWYSHQFDVLPVEEVQLHLPELMARTSLNMPIIEGKSFGKQAEYLDPLEADILEILMRKHGEIPEVDGRALPVEVNDAMLAKL
jgi:hypothetical protein